MSLQSYLQEIFPFVKNQSQHEDKIVYMGKYRKRNKCIIKPMLKIWMVSLYSLQECLEYPDYGAWRLFFL